MKKLFTVLIAFFATNISAGTGYGIVSDITIRSQDQLLLVKVENYNDKPICSTWVHPMGMKFDTDEAKAIYSMLLAAKASQNTVKISGTGSCLDEYGFEVIKEVNIGPWGQ